jgi:dipeptidyl aminopeptidase/acylaminoacyl peptidase
MKQPILAFGVLALAAVAAGAAAAGDATPATARPLHRFLEVRISPDGHRIASVEGDVAAGEEVDLRSLVIRGIDDGTEVTVPLPCGAVPQCWPSSPAWSRDGSHLVFVLRTPGTHAYSIQEVHADGSGLTPLLEFTGTLGNLRYSADGRLAMLAVESARKEVGAIEAGAPITGDFDEAPAEQRIAILGDHRLEWMSPADLFVYEYDWLPGETGFVGTAAPGDGDSNWWTAKLYRFAGAGKPRLLYAPPTLRQQMMEPRAAPDGHAVAFIGGLMSDFGSTGGDVYAVALDSGRVTNLTPGLRASARHLSWDCSGHLEAQFQVDDRSTIATLGRGDAAVLPDLSGGAQETVDLVETDGARSCPAGLIAAAHESFGHAPEIQLGRAGAWRDFTHANVAQRAVGRAVSVHWKSDGYDVQGWLLLPEPAQGRLPMVTIVHGGPSSVTTPTFGDDPFAEALLRRGTAVFRPNPRGSFGQGEAFAMANVRDFGYGDLRDILAGIDAAAKLAPIDLDRLGIAGHSYGGFMTMWAVTQTQRFKAAWTSAGLANWLSYYGENGIDTWMPPFFGATVYDDPDVYARSSAINYIRNVRTPTLVTAAEYDLECPAPQSQEFWHALRARGVPTSLVIYPGEGHHMRDPAHITDELRRALEWFDRYLR